MKPVEHSCLHNGHIWLEASGELYVRHRDRQGTVPVTCLYCEATAELVAHGKATNPAFQEAKKALVELLAVDDKAETPSLRAKIAATKDAFAARYTPAPVKIDP